MLAFHFAMNNYPLVTEEEGEMLTREAWYNYGTDNPTQWQSYGSLDSYVDAMAEKYYPSRKSNLIYTKWEDELFRTSVSQNYELSVSGGNEKSKVFASLAYNYDKELTLFNI